MTRITLSCIQLSLLLLFTSTVVNLDEEKKSASSHSLYSDSDDVSVSMDSDDENSSEISDIEEFRMTKKNLLDKQIHPPGKGLQRRNTREEINLFMEADTLDDGNMDFVLENQNKKIMGLKTVSYTHLTLPTKA